MPFPSLPDIASAPIVELETVDSTNAEAMRRVGNAEHGPLWIRADRQLHGRGRSGRSWATLEGNLAATLLFEPRCTPTELHHLSFVAGVAVHDALTSLSGPAAPITGPTFGIRLKWPNDLLVNGAKFGGILVETTIIEGRPVAAIGIGINIAAAPDLGARSTTSLSALTSNIPTPLTLLRAIAARLDVWLAAWDTGAGFQTVRLAWIERAGAVGEPLTVNAPGRTISGSYQGLDGDGALLIRIADGGIERFTTGDVTLGASSD